MPLPRNKRVVRSAEFRTVYDSGIRMTTRHFTAFCLALQGDAGPSRFGFTTPRGLGKAVKRNHIKRRMQEAVRSQMEALPGTWAVVFNPRQSVLSAPFEELCREVARIFARCSES